MNILYDILPLIIKLYLHLINLNQIKSLTLLFIYFNLKLPEKIKIIKIKNENAKKKYISNVYTSDTSHIGRFYYLSNRRNELNETLFHRSSFYLAVTHFLSIKEH